VVALAAQFLPMVRISLGVAMMTLCLITPAIFALYILAENWPCIVGQQILC
jgi:hypothetical protein